MIAARVQSVMTAGAYLRLRREAAGLSLAQLARLYTYNPLGADATEAMLQEAELDQVALGPVVIDRVAQHMRIDAHTYRRLADHLPPPDICERCGCTWYDACDGGCSWANAGRTLCSACVGRPGR